MTMSSPGDEPTFECYAYIGLDELGSGEVGLKQALTAAGMIPLVAVKREKLERNAIIAQLQLQADRFNQRIRFVRLVQVEELFVIEPRGNRDPREERDVVTH